ncbi:MAG TPA: M20/M25/M40 family metallo-hydrolase [Clostridia bacterium]|nr:M20/M25/M40 family metallo-hydrolase [Clostridia bacterium]
MESDVIDAFIRKVKNEAAQLEKIAFNFRKIIDKSAVLCDTEIIAQTKRICIKHGIKHELLPSGAGHDANAMAAAMPSGMIFVPSKGGYSHCAEEWSEWEHCELGAKVLYDTLLALDASL